MDDCIDLCPDTLEDDDVDDDGCPLEPAGQQPLPSDDGDGDGVSDSDDDCPDTSPMVEVDGDGCAIEDVASQPTPTGMQNQCGACGALGMVSWTLLLMGFVGLRRWGT